MKKEIEVLLLNQRLTIRTEADKDRVDQVARFVSEELQKTDKNGKSASSLNRALLACMNIAGEYLKLKESRLEEAGQVEQKIKGLLEMIEV